MSSDRSDPRVRASLDGFAGSGFFGSGTALSSDTDADRWASASDLCGEFMAGAANGRMESATRKRPACLPGKRFTGNPTSVLYAGLRQRKQKYKMRGEQIGCIHFLARFLPGSMAALTLAHKRAGRYVPKECRPET